MEEEFDFGDFLHDPAEEFNLDSVKEEPAGGGPVVMETFSIDAEKVETKLEPCDIDELDVSESCYIPRVHYQVKDNETYSKEQVTAALLMSQSSLAKVIDMEMFSNLNKTFPITSLYKLEYLVDDLQILPFRDKDLIDSFFQTYSSNPRKWIKFFKVKKKHRKHKDSFVDINKFDIQKEKFNKKAIRKEKLVKRIENSKKKETNTNLQAKSIYREVPELSESDRCSIEATSKKYAAIIDRTVNDVIDKSEANFNGFSKDTESQTHYILEMLMEKLKYLQLELERVNLPTLVSVSDSDSDNEFSENKGKLLIKKDLSCKKEKSKFESNRKIKDGNKESKHRKESDRDSEKQKCSKRELKQNIQSDEISLIKDNEDKKQKLYKKSSSAKYGFKNDSENPLMEPKSMEKESSEFVSLGSSFNALYRTDKKKYFKYKKHKLKNCSVNLYDFKLIGMFSLLSKSMPASERRAILTKYCCPDNKLVKPMPKSRRPQLFSNAVETEGSSNSDTGSSEVSVMGLSKKSEVSVMGLSKKSEVSVMGLSRKLEELNTEPVSYSNIEIKEFENISQRDLEKTHKQEILPVSDAQYDSFDNYGFSDSSSVDTDFDLCEQLKEIDNILKDSEPRHQSLSPKKKNISSQNKNVSSLCSIPVSHDNSSLKSEIVTEKSIMDSSNKVGIICEINDKFDEVSSLSTESDSIEKNILPVNFVKVDPSKKEDNESKVELALNTDIDKVKQKLESITTDNDTDTFQVCSELSNDKKKFIKEDKDIGMQRTKDKVMEYLNMSSDKQRKLIKKCKVVLEDIYRDKQYRRKIKREKKLLFKLGKLPKAGNPNDKVGPLSSKPILIKKDAFEDILSKAMDKTGSQDTLKRKKRNDLKGKEQVQQKEQVSLTETKKAKQGTYLEDVRLKIFREGFSRKINTESDSMSKKGSNSASEELPIFGAAFRIPKKAAVTINEDDKKEPLSLLQRKEEKSTSYYGNDAKYPQNKYSRGLQDIRNKDLARVNSPQEKSFDKNSPGRNEFQKFHPKGETPKAFNYPKPPSNIKSQFARQSPNAEVKKETDKPSVKEYVQDRSSAAIPSFIASYVSNQCNALTQDIEIGTPPNSGNKIPVIINSSQNVIYGKSLQAPDYTGLETKNNGPYTPLYERPPSVNNDWNEHAFDDGMDIQSFDNSPSGSPDSDKNIVHHPVKQRLKLGQSLVSIEKMNDATALIDVKCSFSPEHKETDITSDEHKLIPSYSPETEKLTGKASVKPITKPLPDLTLQNDKKEIAEQIKSQSNSGTEKENVSFSSDTSLSAMESSSKASIMLKVGCLDRKGRIRLYEQYKSFYTSAKKSFYEDPTDMRKNRSKAQKFKKLEYFRTFYHNLKSCLNEQRKIDHERRKPNVTKVPGFQEPKSPMEERSMNLSKKTSNEKSILSPVSKFSQNTSKKISPERPFEKISDSPKDSEPYSPSGSPVLQTEIIYKKPSVIGHNKHNESQRTVGLSNKVDLSIPSNLDESESKIKDLISSFFVDQDNAQAQGKTSAGDVSNLLVDKLKSKVIASNLIKVQKLCNQEEEEEDDDDAPYSPSGSPVIANKRVTSSFDTGGYLNKVNKKNKDEDCDSSKCDSLKYLPTSKKSDELPITGSFLNPSSLSLDGRNVAFQSSILGSEAANTQNSISNVSSIDSSSIFNLVPSCREVISNKLENVAGFSNSPINTIEDKSLSNVVIQNIKEKGPLSTDDKLNIPFEPASCSMLPNFQKNLEDAYEAFSASIECTKLKDNELSDDIDSHDYSPPGSPLKVENVCSSFLSYVAPETHKALIATKRELGKDVNVFNVSSSSSSSEASIEDVVMDDDGLVVERSFPLADETNFNLDNSVPSKGASNLDRWTTRPIHDQFQHTQFVDFPIINREPSDVVSKMQFSTGTESVMPAVSYSSSLHHDSSFLSTEETFKNFNSSFSSLPLLVGPAISNTNILSLHDRNVCSYASSKPSGILGVVVEDVESLAFEVSPRLNKEESNVDFTAVDISLATSLFMAPPPPPSYTPPPEKNGTEDTLPSLEESKVSSPQSEKHSKFSELITEFFQKWEAPSDSQDKQQSDFEVVYSKVHEKTVRPSAQDAWTFYSEPPLAQPIIDKVEKIPLVGLQYILEVRKEINPTVETCSYICSLCSKKMSTATLLAHVKSVPHRLKYTECHSKEIHNKYGKLEVKQWTALLVKEFTTALENLEKNTGRQSMAVVKDSMMNSGITFLKNKVQAALMDIQNEPDLSIFENKMSMSNGRQVLGSTSSERTKSSATVVDLAKSPLTRFKRPDESPRDGNRPRSLDKGRDWSSPRSSNQYSRDRDRSRDSEKSRDADRSRNSEKSREQGRSRDRDRNGDSYRKDKKHTPDKKSSHCYGSQSNSNVSTSKRSRSRSPLRSGRRPQEGSSQTVEERRMKDFRVDESRLKAQHSKELERYTNDPESHPRYKAEWGKFWERRSRDIEQQGRDPRYYDFKADWIPYWKKRIEELCDLEYQAQRKEYLIRYRIEDPDKNKKPIPLHSTTSGHDRSNTYQSKKSSTWENTSAQFSKSNSSKFGIASSPVKEDLILRSHRSVSPWERSHGLEKSSRNQPSDSKRSLYEIEFSVVGTLKLLTDLEDQLGSLVPAAKTLLKKAIDITEKGGRPLELFQDNDNLVLLRLSNVKLNSQINSGILDDMAAARTQMAIESTNWLMKEAEKYYPGSTNDRNPSHMLGLDLNLIATATVGMDTVQVAMYIAQQLLNIGKSDAGETELQQILSAVSAYHLQFKSVNKSFLPPATQQIEQHGSPPEPQGMAPHLSYVNYNLQNYPNSQNNLPLNSENHSNIQHSAMPSSSVPALFPSGAQKSDKISEKDSISEPTATKSGLSLLQTAYEDPTTDMDKLSLSDLQELLSNFRNLSTEKQQALTDYLKKLEATDSKKVTKLRAMMHHSNKPPAVHPKPEREEKVAEPVYKEHSKNEPALPVRTTHEFQSQSYPSPLAVQNEYDSSSHGNFYYGHKRESPSEYYKTSNPYDYETDSKSNDYSSSFPSNMHSRDNIERNEYSPEEPPRNYISPPSRDPYKTFARNSDCGMTSSFRQPTFANSSEFSDSSSVFSEELSGNSFAKPNAPPTDLYAARNYGRSSTSSSFISESFRNFDTGLSLDRPTPSFRSDYKTSFQQSAENTYESHDFQGEPNYARKALLVPPNHPNRFPTSNMPERDGMHQPRPGFRGERFGP